MSKRILITGSIAYDLLMDYDGRFRDSIDPSNLDALSLAYVTRRMKRHFGGTGANIAWGLRILGDNPLLVSTVGNDGAEYLGLLEGKGIDTERIERIDTDLTATAIIGSDTVEQQIIFYNPGADAAGTWPDFSGFDHDISWGIASPREEGMMLACLEFSNQHDIPCLFDPGQQLYSIATETLERSMRLAAGIIANEAEWKILCDRLQTTQEKLIEDCDLLVETKGEKGLTVTTKEETIDIPACPVAAVINPTGAGDALRAGLLSGLNRGLSLREAGQLGVAMGSFAVEQEGTLLEIGKDEVMRRAKEVFG